MTIAAIVLAAAAGSPCPADSNQTELTICWEKRSEAADAALNATYAKVSAGLKSLGIDPKPLIDVQRGWSATRAATCDFEESLEEGGTIAPMMYSQCYDRMTRARTQRLDRLLVSYQNGEVEKPAPVSAKADAELNRVYGAMRKLLTEAQRKRVAASEIAWISYRDKACALEGGACLTELTKERTAEFEVGWLGEQFW